MNTYRGLGKLTPQFRQKVELWLEDNPEIFITESWRPYARQLKLYAQGRTQPGKIVTWTLHSVHTTGRAVDIAFKEGGLYNGDWEKVALSAKKFGIDWGNFLWGRDKPHFQDDGTPLNPNIMQYPEWAKPTVEKMQEKGITTDPNIEVKEMKLYHLLAVIEKFIK